MGAGKLSPGTLRPPFAPWKLKEEHVSRFRTHPSYDKLVEDIEAFFSDIDFYTRYGQTGMRKTLLTGPPGSGKSSMVMALAVAKAKDMPVIVTTDDHFKNVCVMAANLRRPCLIIIEEMDTLISPDSQDLNFLDGIGTPRNVAGTYLISTTNYPKRIDPRIRKRPGRIDLTMQVGALRMKAAAAVALSYLPPDVTLTPDEVKNLGGVFDRTTRRGNPGNHRHRGSPVPTDCQERDATNPRPFSPGESPCPTEDAA